MIEEILPGLLFVFLYFLPAGIANMTPIFVAKMPIVKDWSYPLDCYQTFRGKRILGDHKTIRGLVCGVIAGILVTSLELYLFQTYYFPHINWSRIDPLVFGFLAGFGALSGDAIKSFFKRQKGIASGKTWFPFDQIDYVIGGAICMALYLPLPVPYFYIYLFVVWFLMHPLSTWIGYQLKLKKSPL